MTLIAVCKLCEEKLLYKDENKTILMDHIRDQHLKENEENATEMRFTKNSGWSKMSHSNSKLFTGKQKVQYQMLIDEEERENSQTNYRVSIEVRRVFGKKKIKCPQCESNHKPITRNIHEKSTESSFRSKLIAIFWFCCFSPKVFMDQSLDYVECKNCRYRFGIYDHKQHSFIPYEGKSSTN